MIPLQIIYWILDPYYHFFATNGMVQDVQQKLGRWGFQILAVVILPWVETLLGQGLPWMITRLLRLPATVFLWVATIGFAFLHGLGFQGPDFWVMFLGHLIAAYLLAFTFLQGERGSDWRAIWMTSAVHMLSNLVVGVSDELAVFAKHVTS
ncbi:MAG TPA: hypothetical protein VM166_10430 [Gemmatimonadaceae bacterium]|nr:hypothetical protein [Gemmatimonadaceae bacterium]